MNDLLSAAVSYLDKALGVRIVPSPWDGAGKLPFYLRSHYEYYEAELFGVTCLLVADTAPEAPSVIAKHLGKIRERHAAIPVYLCERVASYNRQRLIQQRVPFVVPGRQMYLPPLGIDLREHFAQIIEPAETLSPSAQALLLLLLLEDTSRLALSDLATRLGYSKMSMSRAIRDLEALELTDRSGGLLNAPRQTWTLAQEHLRSPVKYRRYVVEPVFDTAIHSFELEPSLAGESALAQVSMLAPPRLPVVALNSRSWQALKAEFKEGVLAEPESRTQVVEVWRYDPGILAAHNRVDPLSLALSLRDEADERVQLAVEAVLEGLPW